MFRDYEAFWGLLLTATENIGGPTNVTKYQKVLENGLKISLPDLRKSKNIYNRLGYGLYGFYINPSMVWGIVKSDRITLSKAGNDLANYYLNRCELGKYFLKWKNGEMIDFSVLENLAQRLQTNLPFNQLGEEKKIWENVLSEFLASSPNKMNLWGVNFSNMELGQLSQTPEKYKTFFSVIERGYRDAGHEDLAENTIQISHLEKALSICEFVFDFEYLARCKYDIENFKFELTEKDKKSLLDFYSSEKAQYTHHKQYPIFKRNIDSYDELLNSVINQHIQVQDKKRKAIYMDFNGIRSFGEINPYKLETVLKEDNKKLIDKVVHAYRKDWHIFRYMKYYEYMC